MALCFDLALQVDFVKKGKRKRLALLEPLVFADRTKGSKGEALDITQERAAPMVHGLGHNEGRGAARQAIAGST